MKPYYPDQKPGKPALPVLLVLVILGLTALAVTMLSATWILIRTWGSIAATWWIILGITVWFKPLRKLSYVRIVHIFPTMLYLQQSVLFLGYLLLPSFKFNIFWLTTGNAILCALYLFAIWLWSPRSRFSATLEDEE